MAEAFLFLNCISSGMVDQNNPNQNIRPEPHTFGTDVYIISNYPKLEYRKRLYLKFESFPDQYKYNRLYYVQITVPFVAHQYQYIMFQAYAPKSDFNPTTITYNTRTAGEYIGDMSLKEATGNTQSDLVPNHIGQYDSAAYLSESAVKFLKYSGAYIILNDERDIGTVYVYDETRTQAPTLHYNVRYDDSVIVTSQVVGNGKTSGYVNPALSQTFSWQFEKSGVYYCYGTWTQASATFYWSSDNGSTWTSVAASGSTQSVTLAANTLPVGTIKWYVTATDNVGTTTTTSYYEISTADELIAATPMTPKDTVEDASSPIVFSWNINSPSGTLPKNSRIFYKQEPNAWSYVDIAGSATSYTMPAETLGAGTYIWGVMIQNQAGNWFTSSTVQFISVGAPATPIVSTDGVPYATINWQVDGQQAYRITLDGEVVETAFGTAKTYTFNDFLTDGVHTVSVEVQGIYSLWSKAGTVTFTVSNVSGDAVTLAGTFDRDANLSWETDSTTLDFYILRDGKRIARTNNLSYADRLVLGQHSYQVINRLSDGNYTASNFVTGTMESPVSAITSMNGGWIELKLSENSYGQQSFIWSKTTALRHIRGAVYPVLETSPFEDRSGSYDVSFKDVDSAKLFENLKGQVVILKSRGGQVLVGCLSTLQKVMQDFYISYTFTIQQIHVEDYRDETS